MVKFFTKEMSDQFEMMAGTETEVKAKLAGVTLKFILLATDCPGGEDREMRLEFENGVLKVNTLYVKPAPSDLRTEPMESGRYSAKVACPYDTLVQVSTKGLPFFTALGSMRIEGDMTVLTSYTELLIKLLDIFGSIPGIEP